MRETSLALTGIPVGKITVFCSAEGSSRQLTIPSLLGSGSRTFGNNNNGDIVGFYEDAGGVFHAFLLSNAVFTTIDFPGATFSFAFGLNDTGSIVGRYDDAGGAIHGFLFRPEVLESLELVSYDVFRTRPVASGTWAHFYDGLITSNGDGTINETGGSGTLNDGLVGDAFSTQLFRVTDNSSITLHLPEPTSVVEILLYSFNNDSNTIPGLITGVAVTIDGVTEFVPTIGFGPINAANGRAVHEKVDLSSSVLSLIPTDTVQLSGFTSSSGYGISEITLAGIRDPVVPADFIFTLIADNDTLIPGETFGFNSFQHPSLEDGQITFPGSGRRADDTLQTGIFALDTEALTVSSVIDTDTAMPPDGGEFSGFFLPSRESDDLSFYGRGITPFGGYRAGIFADIGEGLEYVVGNDSGTPMPFFTSNFYNAYQPTLNQKEISFSGYDQTYHTWFSCHRTFWGTRCSGGTNTTRVRGIYSKVGDTVNRVADTKMLAPGGDGTFRYFCKPTADAGSVAFGGYYYAADGNYRTGIYTDQGGTLRVVADQNTPLPDEGGSFDYFNYCSASKDGDQIAFVGRGTTADGQLRRGIYAEIDGSLETLVDSTMPVSGIPQSLSAFSGPSLDDGNVAFSSYWRDDSRWHYAPILISEGRARKVLATGDELDGKTVRYATLRPDGALQGSQVAVWVQFEETQPDGRSQQAIYLAALDQDHDDIADDDDNCTLVANPDQIDSDMDGSGDACQDSDSDAILDVVDNCPLVSNIDQLDTDGDEVGNACDICLLDFDPNQEDADQDGTGDVCDLDSDNDGTLDDVDNCVFIPNDQSDLDLDGMGDVCDADDDGDGIRDIIDGEIASHLGGLGNCHLRFGHRSGPDRPN